MDYVSSTDKLYRDRLFADKLYPAFTKMIESIIRRYELFTPTEDFSDTFNDTMSFLITKVNNYDVSKGAKVYSYCGTICKNYLILKINKYKNEQKRYARYDVIQNEINNSLEFAYDQHENKSQSLQELMDKTCCEIERMMNNSEKYKLNEKELKVGKALCEVLRNWEDLFSQMGSNKFNKSSILMFLKEIKIRLL